MSGAFQADAFQNDAFQTVAGTTFTDSGSGTITLSGSLTQSAVQTGSGSGSLTLSGSSTQSASHTGSGSGTITLSGSGIELFQPPGTVYTDSGSGSITLSGSSVEAATQTGAGVGSITLSGSGAGSQSRATLLSGTITLSGSGIEVFSVGGSPAFTSYVVLNLDTPSVVNVHEAQDSATHHLWRRHSREAIAENLLVYGFPVSAYGTSVVWVVWDLSHMEIISAHETSSDAIGALRRRRARANPSLAVYSIDT